jgi:mRNA interferase MazF
VVSRGYVPDRGDIVWLDFAPQAGREQSGRRPGLVLTPRSYNERTHLAILCPITSHEKGYPFEVALPKDARIGGVILVDHLKSLDWKQRKAERAARAPSGVLQEVLDRLAGLLGFE